MVDRGELDAWKTPGGHRRISRASVDCWLVKHRGLAVAQAPAADAAASAEPGGRARVLLIEDSVHYQNLLSLLVRQQFPQVELHVADDGIAGLAMVGRLDPDILIVDILLPGVDGAALIASLRSHPQFSHCQLIVVTSLDEAQRAPFAFALHDVPLVHKSRLVAELPALLARCLEALPSSGRGPAPSR
jgi:CheY-like chemotaxis protein